LGNWLTAEQSQVLLEAHDAESLKGRRYRAILAVMPTCGLRRSEAADLTPQHLREEHWVIADLVGKAAHIRTASAPGWVTAAIDGWTMAAEITAGRLFRCISRRGTIGGEGITTKVVWHVVREAAAKAGIAKLSAHDCRRTCARRRHTGVASWSRSNFCSGTSRWSDTWVANSGGEPRLTIKPAWSRRWEYFSGNATYRLRPQNAEGWLANLRVA
jgi:integrase